HLAWQLSAINAPIDGPVPVLLSLSRLMRTRAHPFDLAESDLRQYRGDAAAGLAARLRSLADRADGPPIWLLLDGFDEVLDDSVEDAIAALTAWHAGLPRVTIAVLSRPAGWPGNDIGGLFRRAQVEPLKPDQQRALLRTWLGHGAGETTWRRITAQRALADLGKNPLMLTLLAVLSGGPEALPPSRSGLYDKAIDRLLTRGHGPRPGPGVKSPSTARRLLRALSLRLTEQGDITWRKDALVEVTHRVLDDDPKLATECKRTWDTVDEALDDNGHNSGIIAPHDGPHEA
ncbi:MAG: hypothetical protein KC620_21410, partial [Myxococcales bacterium]|nr:hypothetical protein [Myxococcales bacterium]